MEDLSRRDLIKLGAAATLTVSLGRKEALAQSARFFTMEELALVDELSEIIIPADSQSPGARAAKVAAYIDARLAEAWDATEKTTWREGLKAVEQVSRELSGKPFLQSSPDEQLAVVARLARNEAKPEKPEEVFFRQLKARVVDAYYTSEIGIKQEMEYKGNSYLPEFVGFEPK
jgi:glucoside 3-dehydrogenase (cytochrome c) hitch-hiker subunit